MSDSVHNFPWLPNITVNVTVSPPINVPINYDGYTKLPPKSKRIATRKMADKGRERCGERNNFTKYTDEQVAHVRLLRGEGLSYRDIANITGISKSQVGNIVNGYTRKRATPSS